MTDAYWVGAKGPEIYVAGEDGLVRLNLPRQKGVEEPSPVNPRHMYIWGREDASLGLELEERFPEMTEEQQFYFWAYRDGWNDWHGDYGC